MKAFLVMLMVASLSVAVHAQPQAPVEWGPPRWLNMGNGLYVARRVALFGDTILFSAGRPGEGPGRYHSYSHDGGMTCSAWDSTLSGNMDFHVGFVRSSTRLIALMTSSPFRSWILSSLDGGASWGPRQYERQGTYSVGAAAGNDVYRFFSRYLDEDGRAITLQRSTDGGQSWLADQSFDTMRAYPPPDYSLAATREHVVLLAGSSLGWWDSLLQVASFTRDGSPFSPFRELPGQLPGSRVDGCSITADSTSETAIITMLLHTPGTPGFAASRVWLFRTTDGGASWEAPVPLMDSTSLYSCGYPLAFCRGKMWGVAWGDYRGDLRTFFFRISANGGKSWYAEQSLITRTYGPCFSTGQFLGDRVRLFWVEAPDTATELRDFRTMTGTITPDTLAPEVTAVLCPSDTVPVGDTVRFMVQVQEDDTLYEVRFQIRSDQDSAWSLPLETLPGDSFRADWSVPREGFYHYRIEAEDFWENVGAYPDSGWAFFVTEHWSAAEDRPQLARRYGLEVFPNPANGWPSIRLSQGWFASGSVTVTVYNVLGQALWEQRLLTPVALVGAEAFPSPGSGVYFLHVETAQHTELKKFVILK